MERLTRKSLEYKDTWIADGSLSNIEGVVRGNAIDRLAELEDVLEEFELTSAEDLRNYLNFQDNMGTIWESKLDLKNKIAVLEQELAELKQKAIVLEKAFELACDPRDDWGGEEYSGTEFDNYHDYFIAEAEQKLAEIKGEKDE